MKQLIKTNSCFKIYILLFIFWTCIHPHRKKGSIREDHFSEHFALISVFHFFVSVKKCDDPRF